MEDCNTTTQRKDQYKLLLTAIGVTKIIYALKLKVNVSVSVTRNMVGKSIYLRKQYMMCKSPLVAATAMAVGRDKKNA